MFNLLLATTNATEATDATGGFFGTSGGIIGTLVYIVFFGAMIVFLFILPQRKEKKKMSSMYSSMEVGDSVLTTFGCYGVLIDITDEDVIVEFGNNKNCRIPMKKSSIAQVEKPQS